MLQAGAALLTAVSLPSCNGIFEGIYDQPVVTADFGFTKVEQATSSGTIYLDATSYTRWNYIDFETFTLDTTAIAEDGSETGDVAEGWDFAVHRYDVKTNGAAALETGMTGLELFMSSGAMPEGDYVGDEWTTEQIIVDMSGMMDGNIGYSESWYNRELSKWLKVDTGTMPPVYSMSHKVYAVKLADGTHLALKLSNYMDATGVKGFMTIDYVYPVEF